MADLILHLPLQLQKQLQARADAEGKSTDQVAAEILAQAMPVSERGSAQAQVASSGAKEKARYARILQEMHEELKKMNIPNINREELFEELSKAGGKPLSQIIIEERGPKDWQPSTLTRAPSSKSMPKKKVRRGRGRSSTTRKTRFG